MSSGKILQRNTRLELFILPRDEGDARVYDPYQRRVEKYGEQYAVCHDRAIAQRRAYLPEIENPDVLPVQDQSSLDVFFFRRTRMTATIAKAAAPAITRIIVPLSDPVSGVS